MRYLIFLCYLILPVTAYSQKEFQLDTFRLHTDATIRGLSVVNDSIIWLSGSHGYISRSTNGGRTFEVKKINGYDSLDFRDIEAFDEKEAVVLNAGSPAYIFKTNDGGITWKLVYINKQKEIFLNGMDFWNQKKGMAFSDPLNGKMFLLRSDDGGNKWKEVSFKDCPQLQSGEAGFAASGTSIRTVGEGYAFIGTGGKAAHLFSSEDYGETWKKFSCPIIKFKETTGIFSIAFKDARTGVVIGGDYTNDTLSTDNCFLTYSSGKAWRPPIKSPAGYRSCVEYISQTTLLATGITGTDISQDGGLTWKKIKNSTGFNVVRKAKRGTKVFFAGNNGAVGFLEPKK